MSLIDPIRVTDDLRERYVRYVSTVIPFADPELRRQLVHESSALRGYVKGPYLEATPPFESHEQTYGQLVDDGFLSSGFADLLGPDFPAERRPHAHQYKAFERVIAQNRNIVVATGTGSGKTEAFLVPILDHLLRQKEAGEVGAGVRALLLYPMNALANDQLKRLRGLLQHLPFVTFGRYTGETLQNYDRAYDSYRAQHDRDESFAEPLRNELICRDQMHETPPHLLLTNYAMLEYLLLRPAASPLFSGGTWRFIVLDEAHTYDGARGIEVGMLLRRLKDRVAHSVPGLLRCIATSATLGDEQGDPASVVDFASELFGERFAPDDLIRGTKLPLNALGEGSWDVPVPAMRALAEAVATGECDLSRVAEMASRQGTPDDVVRDALTACSPASTGDQGAECGPAVNAFLYALFSQDRALRRLQALMDAQPVQSVACLATEVYPLLGDDARLTLISLVALAARARPDAASASLLPARYHVFVRALEGGFLRLYQQPALYLAPRSQDDVDGLSVPVFEAATCTNCGALYLAGRVDTTRRLVQTPLFGGDSVGDQTELYLVNPPEEMLSEKENEDEAVEGEEETSAGVGAPGGLLDLCTACGTVMPHGSLFANCTDCGSDAELVTLLRAEPAQDDVVRYCPACQTRSQRRSIISRMTLGKDAPVAVLASVLYKHVPDIAKRAGGGRVRNVRQFISFADSRQDAAFFAPYLQRTYGQMLWRRLIHTTLKQYAARAGEDFWDLDALCRQLARAVFDNGIVSAPQLNQRVRDEAWRYLLGEFLRLDRHNDLEATGCWAFRILPPRDWQPPVSLARPPFSLSPDEVWTLYQLLLDTVRVHGAVAFPEVGVQPDDPFFAPRNREIFLLRTGHELPRQAVKWLPASDRHSNARLRLLMKLLPHGEVSGELAIRALGDVWDDLTRHGNSLLCRRGQMTGGLQQWQLCLESWILAGLLR